jgi:hypothetical protein
MEVCLGAAEEAISVLQRTCVNMDQITTTLPTCTDSYAYRGKIRSLLDASATTAAHVSLLLSDAAAVCGRKPDGSVNELLASAQQLQQQLGKVNEQVDASTAQLQAALAAKPLSSTSTLNMQLTQLQKQVASTAALDGCLRAVGTACAALLGLSHREGAAVAKQFLQDTSSSSGQAPGSTLAAAPDTAGAVPAVSKVLKLGDCSMKQLRNGDIYKVATYRLCCLSVLPKQPCACSDKRVVCLQQRNPNTHPGQSARMSSAGLGLACTVALWHSV